METSLQVKKIHHYYPDFEQTFVHHIDASGQGFDCPLFEQQNGQLMILVLAVGH